MADAINGKIEPIEIEEEMKSSYIDYAMSVIVGRALPDVRDGLKPVHRRILYAMHDMGMTPGKPHKKCARIVGEVLGKYHPHGDIAVYDSLVRMAQGFSQRGELIEGSGNFGSIDGDNAAAMRYTEARLSKLAAELLRDLEKDTIDFVPNFDETLAEPTILPARFPNLLVNGSSGIAVGMATNVPPHNLGETIDAVVSVIDNPEADTRDLMKVLKGPDFPTGGIIMGRKGIKEAYETGRGGIVVRGQAGVEELTGGKSQIVVTEIPYQVNKSRLAERIAELAREKQLTEVSDLRDESDMSGVRLVIELKRDAIPEVVLNKLYKHTQLEVSFGVIMLALVDGVPRVLPLLKIIEHYIDHQKEVLIRRTKFELRKAEERAHIVEGLLVALKNLDKAIKTIRESKTVDEAKQKLMKQFSLSDKQAQAILDMRLQRLTSLERNKVREEHKQLIETIKDLKGVLASEKKVLKMIKEDLLEVKKKHADERRTKITAGATDLKEEDLIPEEEMVITITSSGYIKRLPVTTYRQQRRGGKGILAMNLKEGDYVEHLVISSTHNFVLFFTNKGRVYRLKAYEIPQGSRQSKGQAVVNILPLKQGEKVAALVTTPDFESNAYLSMATKKGMVKKTALSDYDTSRREGIIAINLKKGDEVIGVKQTTGKERIILVSRGGQAIKFDESQARAMGRTATGVRGIKLDSGDEVLGMEVAVKGADLLVITEKGYGKRTPMDQYPTQGRGGKGVRTLKVSKQKGKLVGAKMVKEGHELMVVSAEGIAIRVAAEGITRQGRSTQGVKIMGVRGADKVSALAKVVTEEK